MFEEYMRGLRVPGTPIRTFRLRVFLFGVVEVPYSVDETMTAEELADAHSFFNYPPTRSGLQSAILPCSLQLCYSPRDPIWLCSFWNITRPFHVTYDFIKLIGHHQAT
jgi:hypothetical protein